MKLFFLVMAFLCASLSLHADELLKPQHSIALKKPYWALTRFNATKLALLSSDSVDLGEIRDGTFQAEQSFRIEEAQPLRIFSYDCNADGQDELVVSALTRGVPASYILSVSAEKITPLFSRVPWHLAVLEKAGQKILLGQKSRSTQLFAGDVRQLSCSEKITVQEKLRLPRAVNLFEFAFVKTEPLQLVETHDLEPLSVREQDGKKFQQLWQSASRHGSRSTYGIELEGTVLASTQENFTVPHGPLVFEVAGKTRLLASRHEWAFAGMAGKMPFAKSAQFVFYQAEPALGFDEFALSKTIAGSVLDSILDKTGQNEAELWALIAPKGQPHKRLLLRYELK